MSIRGRLLVVLLLLTVVPLVLVTAVAQLSTRAIGFGLAERAEREGKAGATELLERLTLDNARLITARGDLAEAALRRQRDAAERALAGDQPETDRPVFYAESFGGPDGPADLAARPPWSIAGADGPPVPLVSLEHQAFYLVGDAAASASGRRVRALATLTDEYAQASDLAPGLLAHYTTLVEGVHGVWPGHGSYPAGYDPRRRLWFIEAMERPGVVWSLPYFDVATGRPVLTASLRVRDAAGAAIGVTAVDLDPAAIVGLVRLPTAWAEGGRAMLVYVPTEAEAEALAPGAGRVLIIAEPRGERRRDRWRDDATARSLRTDSPEEDAALARALTTTPTGVTTTTIDGVRSVLAWSALEQGVDLPGAGGSGTDRDKTLLVTVVPERSLAAAAVSARSSVAASVITQLASNISAILLIAGAAVAAAFVVSRAAARPLESLTEAAERVGDGELDVRAELESPDEFGRLADAFNRMVPQLRDRVRLRESLDLAMQVQQSLLPGAPPTIDGLDVAGASVYCDETGGDYYDFLGAPSADGGRFAVVVGDVSGHGVAAALLMTSARALLRTRFSVGDRLAGCVAGVNGSLADDDLQGRFMTMCLVGIDPATREVSCVNAGHDPPVIYRRGGGFDDVGTGDIPLGIEPGWAYTEHPLGSLSPGDVLVIGTDGIWEARSPGGEMFGRERLRALVREHHAEPAARIAERVLSAVEAFRGSRPQEDDITLVVIRATDPGATGTA